MKPGIILTLLACCGLAFADNADDASAKVREYFEVFNARDIERVATQVYATPVHVGGGETHRVLATPAAAIENLTGLYKAIDAQGWRESVIENLKVCMASDTLALIDTRYSRIDHDGQPIPPAIRTNLYVLQKLAGEWRIVAFYAHDADRRPQC